MKAAFLWISLALGALCGPLQGAVAAGKSLNIAMVLWRGETDAERGFRDGLAEHGYAAKFTVFNAGQDKGELGRLLRKSVRPRASEFDYIYTFGTTVSKTTQVILDGQTPQVFNIVADPVKADIVDSLSAPGRNISGASNAVPVALQLEAASKVFPFKRLGLLFNPREKNSMVVRNDVTEAAQGAGFEVVDLKSPPARNALEQNLDKLADGSVAVDAVYLPADSFMVSNAALIGSRLQAAGVKSIGAIKAYITNGALLGVVPNYHEMGRAVADIVDRHQKGEALAQMAVSLPRAPTLVVNRATGNALGVVVPSQLKPQYVE